MVRAAQLSFAFLLHLVSVGPALAQDAVVLFENGEQVKEYNRLVLDLKPGQTIQFSNGDRYVVQEILGHGNTTLIVSDGETARRLPLWRGHRGLVVAPGEPNPYDWSRIRSEGGTVPSWHGPDPLAPENRGFDGRFSAIHREFGQSQREVELAGVGVLPIDFTNSLPGEYWQVERVQVIETLDSFIEDMANRPEGERNQRLERLKELVLSTYRCTAVGDFSPRQIAWTGERWILLDHRGGVEPAISVGGMTAVTRWNRLFPDNKLWQEFVAGAEYEIKAERGRHRETFTELQIPLKILREKNAPRPPSKSVPQPDRQCQIMGQSFEYQLQ